MFLYPGCLEEIENQPCNQDRHHIAAKRRQAGRLRIRELEQEVQERPECRKTTDSETTYSVGPIHVIAMAWRDNQESESRL